MQYLLKRFTCIHTYIHTCKRLIYYIPHLCPTCRFAFPPSRGCPIPFPGTCKFVPAPYIQYILLTYLLTYSHSTPFHSIPFHPTPTHPTAPSFTLGGAGGIVAQPRGGGKGVRVPGSGFWMCVCGGGGGYGYGGVFLCVSISMLVRD